jgi:hypothetical protein
MATRKKVAKKREVVKPTTAKVVKPTKKKPARTRRLKTREKGAQPFAGKRFAFFGEFAIWPSYHFASPEKLAEKLGATVVDELDDRVDVVVFGERRGTGRSAATKRAHKLAGVQILDEAAFRELVRVDLTAKRFAFIGGFDCSPQGLDDGLLARMVENAGGVVTPDIDATLDYLVVGNRRGPSKIALANRAAKLNEAGANIVRLDESQFLELVRVDKPAAAGGQLDFAGFLSQLYGRVDERKLGRALDMLRKEAFKLYARLDDNRLVGVVRSQSGHGSVYASWLTDEGRYGCSTPELDECMGLQGTICKHLLVLVCGLTRTGQLPLERALGWVGAAHGHSPREDKTLCAETFIQYKGAEAGQVDWRPTETIPEDFYAM